MHIHRGRLLRRAAYALIVVAACVAVIVPVTGVGAFRQGAESWRSAFQKRPHVPASQKVIVVLSFPSFADRGTSYARWREAHPSAACTTFDDC